MKKLFLSFALTCASINAMSLPQDENSGEEISPYANWQRDFILVDGSTLELLRKSNSIKDC